jgi:hypothetical protein
VPDGQAEIFVCADNFHGRALGITGFSTEAALEHFGQLSLGFKLTSFSNVKALEEAITPSFGNDWQAIEIARGHFTPYLNPPSTDAAQGSGQTYLTRIRLWKST